MAAAQTVASGAGSSSMITGVMDKPESGFIPNTFKFRISIFIGNSILTYP